MICISTIELVDQNRGNKAIVIVMAMMMVGIMSIKRRVSIIMKPHDSMETPPTMLKWDVKKY